MSMVKDQVQRHSCFQTLFCERQQQPRPVVSLASCTLHQRDYLMDLMCSQPAPCVATLSPLHYDNQDLFTLYQIMLICCKNALSNFQMYTIKTRAFSYYTLMFNTLPPLCVTASYDPATVLKEPAYFLLFRCRNRNVQYIKNDKRP